MGIGAVIRDFAMKLRLAAVVLGCTSRKELAAAFREVNPDTTFDVERADKWLSGKALPRTADGARAMDYMLKRWPSFARFLDDGRICLTNNAAERALRGVALGRKSWLFVGSDRGGVRAAIMYTLIGTAKLNDIDPQAWLADVLERIASHPIQRLPELLPWHWRPATAAICSNAA